MRHDRVRLTTARPTWRGSRRNQSIGAVPPPSPRSQWKARVSPECGVAVMATTTRLIAAMRDTAAARADSPDAMCASSTISRSHGDASSPASTVGCFAKSSETIDTPGPAHGFGRVSAPSRRVARAAASTMSATMPARERSSSRHWSRRPAGTRMRAREPTPRAVSSDKTTAAVSVLPRPTASATSIRVLCPCTSASAGTSWCGQGAAGIDVTEASGCPAQAPARLRNTTFSRWRDPHRQRRRPDAGVMESNG